MHYKTECMHNTHVCSHTYNYALNVKGAGYRVEAGIMVLWDTACNFNAVIVNQ